MKKLLLLICAVFCLNISAQSQNPCGSTCVADPVITPNNFNYCPVDSICLDSNGSVVPCPHPTAIPPAGWGFNASLLITISSCENSTFTYSTPLNIGSTYNWTVSGNSSPPIINNNEITITWGSQGTGIISVEEIDAQGCVGTYTFILPCNL